MHISRGFGAALIGISVTVLAWIGPWLWPAWPAFTVLRLVFGSGFGDISGGARAAAIVGLIAVNVAFWAAVAYAILCIAAYRYRRSNS